MTRVTILRPPGNNENNEKLGPRSQGRRAKTTTSTKIFEPTEQKAIAYYEARSRG